MIQRSLQKGFKVTVSFRVSLPPALVLSLLLRNFQKKEHRHDNETQSNSFLKKISYDICWRVTFPCPDEALQIKRKG